MNENWKKEKGRREKENTKIWKKISESNKKEKNKRDIKIEGKKADDGEQEGITANRKEKN